MSYSCETNAILPQVQLLIGIGFGPVRFECHENVDILDIRPPKKRRSRLRTRAGSALICGRNPAGRHGVSTESGSDRVKADSNNRDCQDYYPVATALGTDLILKLGHYPRARRILRLQTLLDNHGFRAVTMIISAGKLIWLLGKNSRTASSTSDATLAVCAAVSLANFSLKLSDISERISQYFSREIGASIRNLK